MRTSLSRIRINFFYMQDIEPHFILSSSGYQTVAIKLYRGIFPAPSPPVNL